MRFIAFVILCVIFAHVSWEKDHELQDKAVQETYCHPRFGYCISYDTTIFSKIPDGIEADGMIISNRAGTALFESYGSYNPNARTVASLRAENLSYLLRDGRLHAKIVKEAQDAQSYMVTIEREDAFLQQQLVMDQLYFKVLTIKVDRRDPKLAEHVMASTRFVPNVAVASR